MTDEEKITLIKKHIKTYPDFPKPGILFIDVFSLFMKPDIISVLKDVLISTCKKIPAKLDCVVGCDARGFLFGPMIALDLQIPFVPVRKKGKLPGETAAISFSLEYGQDTLEIQTDSIKKGQNVLIVDDLLATGGTLSAACQLITKLGANPQTCLVIIEIMDLNGRDKCPSEVISLLKY